MNSEQIQVNHISFSYGSKEIIDNISFDLESNQVVAILGNNGAGKSTLLKCISGLFHTKGSSVYLKGEEILAMDRREIAKRIAYVAQKNEGSRITVFDAVLLGRKPYIKWDATKEDLAMVSSIIHQLELDQIKLCNIDEISGGELQKVMIARALAQEPSFLMLDEPTSSLDPRNQYGVMSLVKKVAKERGIAVAVVMHDLNLALRYCDRFIVLRNRKIYSYGGVDTMTKDLLEKVYDMPVTIKEYNGIKVIIPMPQW